MSSRGNLIILSAPSGSGKTSLALRILPQLEGIRFSVSHTTRPMRQGEVDAKEYFFVTEARFKEMIAAGQFLEWAEVYGNYYGTSRGFVVSELQQGTDVLLDIDIQGAFKVKEAFPEAVMIFVLPPSFEELGDRLRRRGLDDEEVIQRRLEIAKREIQYYRKYDYVIINRDLERSVDELKALIIGTRCRVGQQREAAEEILETFWDEC